uniref:hypothetical protein n=1 Tax=Neorhizobium sp. EC2-8 TaxID=3129230 RepID=UPI0031015463
MRPPLDPRTQATVTVAWVIVANKPFYPLYVWYLVGNGVTASLGTLLAAPFFLAIPLIARHAPRAPGSPCRWSARSIRCSRQSCSGPAPARSYS